MASFLPRSSAIELVQAKLVWKLSDKTGFPKVFAKVLKEEASLKAASHELQAKIPVAKQCRSFVKGSYCRPYMHRRCFYLRLPSGGSLGFKGTEPLARDFDSEVAFLEASREPYMHSLLNRFVIQEHKVALGVSVDEAIREATLTARFQSDYLAKYGRLARVPVPLFVSRLPERAGVRLLRTMEKVRLSELALSHLSRLLERGLGVLVYYYPDLPMRAQHVAIATPPESTFSETMAELRKRVSPERAIENWIDLLIDMLFLGYLPFDTYFMGHCLQSQNLCVDGGFADMDSIIPMREIENERRLQELFLHTLSEFARSVSEFLLKGHDTSHAAELMKNLIWEEFFRRARKRLRRQTPLDRRLKGLLAEAPLMEKAELLLSTVLPGAGPKRAEFA
jgi:hypothetical protein